MSSHNVEELDDEELLVLYETTKKLWETKKDLNEPQADVKKRTIRQKLTDIEEELKVRCLWEGE